MKNFKFILLAALVLPFTTAFAQVRDLSMADAVCDSVSSHERRTYRHSEAVQRLTIYRDTLSARQIWSELIEEDSTYSPAYYYLSRLEDERSLEYARRAYEADSSNKWYVMGYGERLIYSHRYSKALPVYRRLLSLDNREISAYHTLALLYGTYGMPYSSIAILDSAEMRLGRNPYLGAIKQQLLLDTHQYKRAIEEGERLCAEAPYEIDYHLSLAEAYEASRDITKAEEFILKAYKIDTTNLDVIVSVVDFYYRNARYSDMLDFDERLFSDKRAPVEDKRSRLEEYTSNIDFYRNNYFRIGSIIVRLTMDYPDERAFRKAYAMHLIYGGMGDEAYDYMLRHVDDSSSSVEDYIFLLEYMVFSKRSDEEVLAIMDKALKRFADSEELSSFRGFYYTEKEEYNKAIKIFRMALGEAKRKKNNTLISKYLGYIGDIYYTQGKSTKAFMAYSDALHYDGNNIPVLNNYAYYLSLTGRGLDKALTMANLAMSLERSNYTYIDTCAWVLHQMGRDEEAKRLMQRALSLGGQDDPDILAHYGDILWSLGEEFMANIYWDKAVKSGFDKEEMKSHKEQIQQNDDK